MGSKQHLKGDPNAIEIKENEIKIFPKGLNVVWGGNKRYWQLPTNNKGPLELKQVCWLEVTCSVDITKITLAKGNKYVVGFNYSLTPDAFGWGNRSPPLFIMRKIGKEEKNATWTKIHSLGKKGDITSDERTNEEMLKDPILYFGLYEVWSGKWKGGLKIHHAFVRKLCELQDILGKDCTNNEATIDN